MGWCAYCQYCAMLNNIRQTVMCMRIDLNLIELSVFSFYAIPKYLLFVEFLKIDVTK